MLLRSNLCLEPLSWFSVCWSSVHILLLWGQWDTQAVSGTQGQAGWGLEPPGLGEGEKGAVRSLLTQTILGFCVDVRGRPWKFSQHLGTAWKSPQMYR